MIDVTDDLCSRIGSIARKAVQSYTQGILSVGLLAEQMLQEWEYRRVGEAQPSDALLMRIAQRICSHALFMAWRSPDADVRNCAFDNLRRYLEFSLRRTSYVRVLAQHANAMEDVLHQALTELHLALVRDAEAGPDDPAAFLKWTQTILIRHAYAFVQKCQREPACISLEGQPEGFSEQFVDRINDDPQEQVLQEELQQTLKNAILSLRNVRYQQVLICTYLAGMAESELAYRLGVQVQDVYMWRHRALKALRSKPEVMQALRPWL